MKAIVTLAVDLGKHDCSKKEIKVEIESALRDAMFMARSTDPAHRPEGYRLTRPAKLRVRSVDID